MLKQPKSSNLSDLVIGDRKYRAEDEKRYTTDGKGIRSANLLRHCGEGDNTEWHEAECHQNDAHDPPSHLLCNIGLQKGHI